MKRELKGERAGTEDITFLVYRKAHPDEKGTESIQISYLA